jgi:hypothetical protein
MLFTMKNKESTILDDLIAQAKPEDKIYIKLNIDIRERVLTILKSHETIKSIDQLAVALKIPTGKMHVMLNGMYNLTIEDISKITAVLGGKSNLYD